MSRFLFSTRVDTMVYMVVQNFFIINWLTCYTSVKFTPSYVLNECPSTTTVTQQLACLRDDAVINTATGNFSTFDSALFSSVGFSIVKFEGFPNNLFGPVC